MPIAISYISTKVTLVSDVVNRPPVEVGAMDIINQSFPNFILIPIYSMFCLVVG